MIADIVSLRAFYASQLGERVARVLSADILKIWPQAKDQRVLGLGFAIPFLTPFIDNAERVLAFMPARQGACQWPTPDDVASALVFEEELPLCDSSVDRIILVHSLEYAENAEEMLKEMWRVLSPNCRILIVVPNRTGLWARYEHTPFGNGEPYTSSQIVRLLRAANFTTGAVQSSLYFSPSPQVIPRILSSFYGKIAAKLVPYFGGILLIEGQKRLYQGVPVTPRLSRRIFIPSLAPQRRIISEKLEIGSTPNNTSA